MMDEVATPREWDIDYCAAQLRGIREAYLKYHTYCDAADQEALCTKGSAESTKAEVLWQDMHQKARKLGRYLGLPQ